MKLHSSPKKTVENNFKLFDFFIHSEFALASDSLRGDVLSEVFPSPPIHPSLRRRREKVYGKSEVPSYNEENEKRIDRWRRVEMTRFIALFVVDAALIAAAHTAEESSRKLHWKEQFFLRQQETNSPSDSV